MSLKKNLLTFILFTSLAASAEPNVPGMIQNKYSPSPVAVQWANRGVELANQGDYPAAIEALYEAWKLSPEKTNSFAVNLSSAYNNLGKQLADAGKFDEAVTQLRKAVFFQEENKIPAANLDLLLKRKGLNPEDLKTRLAEAQRLRGSGNLDEAVAEYLKAISLSKAGSPDNFKAKLELAQVYQVLYTKYILTPVGQARFDKMYGLIQDLIKINPKDSKPYILLGRAYLAAEKLPEGIETFEAALKMSPNDKQALDGLVGAWRKVLEIAPNETANMIGLAGALMRAGNVEEAGRLLQKAKSLDPKNPEIDKMLADSKQNEKQAELYRVADRAYEAQKAGKFDEAIDLYQIAIKNLPPTPETSNIYYNLGLGYQAKGRTQDSLNAFNQALKFNPANDNAKRAIQAINQQTLAAKNDRIKKAVSLQSAGKVNEAISLYQQILKESPNDAQLHFNLGTAFQEAGVYQQALIEYRTAAKLDPKNSEFSAAVSALQEAISSGAFQAAQANNVLKEAVNLQQAGKMAQAITKYQEAIKLDPKSAQAHFNLGTAFHASNRSKEALVEYKEAYRLDPSGFPEANYFIGNLMEYGSSSADAVLYYKRYLEDQPKSEYSSQAEERIKLLSGS